MKAFSEGPDMSIMVDYLVSLAGMARLAPANSFSLAPRSLLNSIRCVSLGSKADDDEMRSVRQLWADIVDLIGHEVASME
jgi:hypothetical protein